APLVEWQEYYARRNPKNLTYAVNISDGWWRNPDKFDSGHRIENVDTGDRTAPRQIALGGLALYSLYLRDQGNTTKADAIAKAIDRHSDVAYNLYVTRVSTSDQTSFGTPREGSYATYNAFVCANMCLDRTGTVNTSGTTVTWVSGDNFHTRNS